MSGGGLNWARGTFHRKRRGSTTASARHRASAPYASRLGGQGSQRYGGGLGKGVVSGWGRGDGSTGLKVFRHYRLGL